MAEKVKRRKTQAKTAIVDILKQSTQAMTHQDIELALDGLCNRVTIYRVLDRLVREDLAHKLVDVDGVTKYLACRDCGENHLHHHVHFSCEQCGELTCLYHVVPKFTLPEGYHLSEVNFTVRGDCPKCSATSSAAE